MVNTGRKKNLFNVKLLSKANINKLAMRVAKFNCKDDELISSREIHKVESLVYTLRAISESSYRSKTAISNKLLDDILNNNTNVINVIKDYVHDIYDYDYSDIQIQDTVYHIIFFGAQVYTMIDNGEKADYSKCVDPEYEHLADYIKDLEGEEWKTQSMNDTSNQE